jgi:S-DNA-T family DNA segregation ATPase FtsK/SpoIIIE
MSGNSEKNRKFQKFKQETGRPDPKQGVESFRINRYAGDAIGLLFVVLAILTLMGLLEFTKGSLLSVWVAFLKTWMGWGAYFTVFFFGFTGGMLMARNNEQQRIFPIRRIIALEGLMFSLMALLSTLGGQSLQRASQGLDGGFIGWGLAEIVDRFLPAPISTIIWLLVTVLLAVSSLGLTSLFSNLVDKLLEDEELVDEPLTKTTPFESHAPAQKSTGRKPKKAAETKPQTQLKRGEHLPPLDLVLSDRSVKTDETSIHDTARRIEKALADFGIPATVVGFRQGPTVTQFAVEPGFVEKTTPDGEVNRQKVRVAQIANLHRDLALALSAERLRIEAPVPGQAFVGVEVPNTEPSLVRLRNLLESRQFLKTHSPLALALGRDVSGLPVVGDLSRMPHLLIAGTTGSGKSVCIAAITLCLVMNNSPQMLKLAMLDPKMVELVRFNGLPHLFNKVETEPERMLGVLKWGLAEMDRRYRLLEAAKVRDIDAYNEKANRRGEPALARVVILIDELADLMMSAPDQTEHALVRLAQLARATGIHLIVATQRPSTDVVTGLIKANFPARIAFNVASSIDSRVILDGNGAESLLGNGDMLFLDPEAGAPLRAQGVLVSDTEIENVIEFWQAQQNGEVEPAPWEEMIESAAVSEGQDDLIDRAIKIVRDENRASASMLQRRLRVGYPRAARLIDELEELGVVGPSQGGGREREVLIQEEDDDEDANLDYNVNEESEDE